VGEIVSSSRSPVEEAGKTYELIPTGSTLLNLCLADNAKRGFAKGSMVNLIGDSSSGKTIVALNLLACIAHHPGMTEYALIYDDAEHRNQFDLSRLFGQKMADRVEAPETVDGQGKHSELIEDFQRNIYSRLKAGKPFIYILDSMDSLDARADVEKFEKTMEKEKGEKTAGSYGMAKAKGNSELLRRICGKLGKSNSLLIIISQTRDSIDPMSFQEKTRSGGKALKFYATHEIWMALGESLFKTVNGRKLKTGIVSKLRVKKNSLTGKEREIMLAILYNYGVDDTLSMIRYMIFWGIWKDSNGRIDCPEFGGPMTEAKLIRTIEDGDRGPELRDLVAKTWHDVEEQLMQSGRKRRYE